jgi:hypothetical protein
MSKRLLIWIGLVILVGMISAAGWSVYVTVNSTATEAKPPPVTGKIPPMPQTSSGAAVDQAPAAPTQEQGTTDAAGQEPAAANARMTPDAQPRSADPAPKDQSAEGSPLTPQAPPAPEPVEQAPAESPADPADAPDSRAPQSPEPPPAKSEAPVEQAPEAVPANKAAQESVPEQVSEPNTSGKAPAAVLSAAPEPPADSRFTIQTGSYRKRKNAESVMSELSGKGYDAYVHEVTYATSPAWYAVRFGRFPTFTAAQQALSVYQEKERQKAIIVNSSGR